MQIPFSPPDINQVDIDHVVEALKSGWITTGPRTKQFESELSSYFGTEKTVCLNSATACMESTLRLLGIGAGDEVITSAYTYTASASVIAHVGAKPVLVDVDPDSYFISPEKIANAITDKTKAVIPIDIGGIPADFDKIYQAIEQKKNLFKASNDLQSKFNRVVIMDDAAHSLGASYKGKMVGNVADFSCFSLHAVKNLTTAEGGCVTWKNIDGIDNEEIYKMFMLLSLHGQSKDALAKTKLGSWHYDIKTLGYKCNMTDVAAALGLSQLHRYDELESRRKQISDTYTHSFSAYPQIEILQKNSDDYQSSYHLYLTRIKNASENQRNEIINRMAECGIATNVHYIPLPMHTAYKNLGFDIKDFPNSLAQYQNEISLPLYSTLTDEQQQYIINNYIKIIKDLDLC